MVKNPSPVRGGAADLRLAVNGQRACAHGRTQRFHRGKRAENNARAGLIALWPCANMRMGWRAMVNKAYPPRLRGAGGSGESIDVEATDQLLRPRQDRGCGHARGVRP